VASSIQRGRSVASTTAGSSRRHPQGRRRRPRPAHLCRALRTDSLPQPSIQEPPTAWPPCLQWGYRAKSSVIFSELGSSTWELSPRLARVLPLTRTNLRLTAGATCS
jgi:hypothetical protein